MNAECLAFSASRKTVDSCVAEFTSHAPQFVKSVLSTKRLRASSKADVFRDKLLSFVNFQAVYWNSSSSSTSLGKQNCCNNYLVLGYVNGSVEVWLLRTAEGENENNSSGSSSLMHNYLPRLQKIVHMRVAYPVAFVQLLDDFPGVSTRRRRIAVSPLLRSVSPSPSSAVSAAAAVILDPYSTASCSATNHSHNFVSIFESLEENSLQGRAVTTAASLITSPTCCHVLQQPYPVTGLMGSLCRNPKEFRNSEMSWIGTLVVLTTFQIRVYNTRDFELRFNLSRFQSIIVPALWKWFISDSNTTTNASFNEGSFMGHSSEKTLGPVVALGTRWLVFQEAIADNPPSTSYKNNSDNDEYNARAKLVRQDEPAVSSLRCCATSCSSVSFQADNAKQACEAENALEHLHVKNSRMTVPCNNKKNGAYPLRKHVDPYKNENIKTSSWISKIQKYIQRFVPAYQNSASTTTKDDDKNGFSYKTRDSTTEKSYDPLLQGSSRTKAVSRLLATFPATLKSVWTVTSAQGLLSPHDLGGKPISHGGRLIIIDVLTGEETGEILISKSPPLTGLTTKSNKHNCEKEQPNYVKEMSDGVWCLSYVESKKTWNEKQQDVSATASTTSSSSSSRTPLISLLSFDLTGTTLFCVEWTGRTVYVCRITTYDKAKTRNDNQKCDSAISLSTVNNDLNPMTADSLEMKRQKSFHYRQEKHFVVGKAVYELRRGETVSSVIDITSTCNTSIGNYYVAILTSRGRCHVFSLSPGFHQSLLPNTAKVSATNHFFSPVSLTYPESCQVHLTCQQQYHNEHLFTKPTLISPREFNNNSHNSLYLKKCHQYLMQQTEDGLHTQRRDDNNNLLDGNSSLVAPKYRALSEDLTLSLSRSNNPQCAADSDSPNEGTSNLHNSSAVGDNNNNRHNRSYNVSFVEPFKHYATQKSFISERLHYANESRSANAYSQKRQGTSIVVPTLHPVTRCSLMLPLDIDNNENIFRWKAFFLASVKQSPYCVCNPSATTSLIPPERQLPSNTASSSSSLTSPACGSHQEQCHTSADNRVAKAPPPLCILTASSDGVLEVWYAKHKSERVDCGNNTLLPTEKLSNRSSLRFSPLFSKIHFSALTLHHDNCNYRNHYYEGSCNNASHSSAYITAPNSLMAPSISFCSSSSTSMFSSPSKNCHDHSPTTKSISPDSTSQHIILPSTSRKEVSIPCYTVSKLQRKSAMSTRDLQSVCTCSAKVSCPKDSNYDDDLTAAVYETATHSNDVTSRTTLNVNNPSPAALWSQYCEPLTSVPKRHFPLTETNIEVCSGEFVSPKNVVLLSSISSSANTYDEESSSSFYKSKVLNAYIRLGYTIPTRIVSSVDDRIVICDSDEQKSKSTALNEVSLSQTIDAALKQPLNLNQKISTIFSSEQQRSTAKTSSQQYNNNTVQAPSFVLNWDADDYVQYHY